MKSNIRYILPVALMGLAACFVSCSEDKLSPDSVITVDKTEQNEFDKWLEVNYVNPYNIDFRYRYTDAEGHMSYYMVPSKIEDAVILAHLVKYLCLEAYDNIVGVDFTRANFPKMIYTTGTWEFKNNGTYILGTAEGGKKIYLMGTAYIKNYIKTAEDMNHYYLKTIHHEFTHILNQTKDYSPEFKQITGTTYVSDSWSDSPYNVDYLKRGYISAYAQDEDREDLAELVALYITNTADQWEEGMVEADEGDNDGKTGRELIEAKLDIVRAYMQTQWNIDLDDMRAEIQKRQNDVISGKVDLSDLTIK